MESRAPDNPKRRREALAKSWTTPAAAFHQNSPRQSQDSDQAKPHCTYEIEDMGGHWDRHRQVNSTLFGLASASETGNIVRSCSTLPASALVSLMLSGCLLITIPI